MSRHSPILKEIKMVHVVIESPKPFAQVKRALEKLIPPIDPEIANLLLASMNEQLKQKLQAAPELMIFLTRDHGELLAMYGESKKAVQYEIGNAYTASTMTRYVLSAGLYAPLRVYLYEKDNGITCIEYDLPSSLFGQFGDERVTQVALKLDNALERAVNAAMN